MCGMRAGQAVLSLRCGQTTHYSRHQAFLSQSFLLSEVLFLIEVYISPNGDPLPPLLPPSPPPPSPSLSGCLRTLVWFGAQSSSPWPLHGVWWSPLGATDERGLATVLVGYRDCSQCWKAWDLSEGLGNAGYGQRWHHQCYHVATASAAPSRCWLTGGGSGGSRN